MTNSPEMTNDEILMTNKCPNDPMTKKHTGQPICHLGFVINWSFVLRHLSFPHLIGRALTFVIPWSFFLGMAAASRYLSLTYGL
jgi:hypothetical protein